jgi:hypothetical protein
MPGVKRLIAAVSLVVLGCAALLVTATPGLAASHPMRAASSTFTASPTQLRGHGELAVISKAHQLYLIGARAGGVRRVALADPAHNPIWSHDGRWLAVTTQPASPKAHPVDEPTTVWLVSRAGNVVRRLTPAGQDVYHAAVAWSPRADQVAMSYTSGVGTPAVTMRLDVVDTSGRRASLGVAPLVAGFAWAPNGLHVAASLNTAPSGKWDSRLVSIDARSARQRTITTDQGDVLDVAGWWPDGSGVLTWLDYQGSASLAADGLPLLDVSAATGHRRLLTKTMLQYGGWLATSKLKNSVALIAGGDRVLTGGHKHLVICTRTRCHAVAQGSHQVTFDPAYNHDGRLAVVRDHAVRPTVANGYYSLTFTHKVDASGGIGLVRGGKVHRIAGGNRATAPVWGARGSMLEVRGSSLWLLRDTGAAAHRVAGPLDTSDNFFGFVSWWDSFAWSAAVG